MRKYFAMILVIGLLLLFGGCQDNPAPTQPTPPPDTSAPAVTEPTVPEPTVTEPAVTEPTEPETTVPEIFTMPAGFLLAGVDLGGMTPEEAALAVENAMADYSLSLIANGESVVLSSELLGVSLNKEALLNYLTSLEANPDAKAEGLATCDSSIVEKSLKDNLGRSVRDAGIQYQDSQGIFVAVKHRTGLRISAPDAALATEEAVGALASSVPVHINYKILYPSITDNDPRIAPALEQANSYLGIQLAYHYETGGVTTATETLSNQTLASFLSIDQDFHVSVDDGAILDYVNQAAEQHSGPTYTDKFTTTYGGTVNHNVTYYGATLNTAAMVEDLKLCFTQHISGTRIAPYIPPSGGGMPYGGNYVEISLNDQYLWVYRDGKCVVSSPLVSGNVSSYALTPTGVGTVYSKSRNVYLQGRNFTDFVNYWMPFNKNIGMHDATWRTEFGDEIYLYNGSHGCINLPLSVAAQVYENVSVGTKVIVYGGKRTASWMDQEFSGTMEYDVAQDAENFPLDVKVKYRGVELTYRSSNKDVVTVSEDGVVTIVGPGQAEITVKSKAVGVLRAATAKVAITVHTPCQEGRHNFVSDQSQCTSGCGTENPGYIAPTEPATEQANAAIATEEPTT